MTDSVSIPNPGRLAKLVVDDKSDAFRRASRHSSRVKWLRAFFLFGSLALCLGIVLFAFFNPFRAAIPDNVSIEGAGLTGSRVTMAHPKMSGYRRDGRPYDFVAQTAVQDLKSPSILELNQLDAHVTLSDKSVAHVTADTGIYDSSNERMDLKSNIHITSDSGYDIRLITAHIEFKGGDVASNDPVSVVMKTGTVSSDRMHMINNGAQITFEGHVRSLMQPATDTGAVAPLKGTAP